MCKHSPDGRDRCSTFDLLRRALRDGRFIGRHRRRPGDFTRRRRLSFDRVMILLLQKTVRSVQLHLNEFFDRLGRKLEPVTASAWCQARLKLRHTALIELNQRTVVEVVYGSGSTFPIERWQGHRLLAIDSSLLSLPETEAMGREFGWVACQNQKGECGRHVQGRLSVLSDVLNRFALETFLVGAGVSERALAVEHVGALQAGDVVLLDRGYAGYGLWASLSAARRDFVCRCGRSGFAVVEQLLNEDRADRSVITTVQPSNGKAQRNREKGLPPQITVRFVTVRLSTGELEVLATSLLDGGKYPARVFGEVYARRWAIETCYGLLKGRLDLENFSGQSVEAVRQDVYATILLSNLETILTEPVQRRMEQRQVAGSTGPDKSTGR